MLAQEYHKLTDSSLPGLCYFCVLSPDILLLKLSLACCLIAYGVWLWYRWLLLFCNLWLTCRLQVEPGVPICGSIWCCNDVWLTILKYACDYPWIPQLACWCLVHHMFLLVPHWRSPALGSCWFILMPQLVVWCLQLVQHASWLHVTLAGQIKLFWCTVALQGIASHCQVGSSCIKSGLNGDFHSMFFTCLLGF